MRRGRSRSGSCRGQSGPQAGADLRTETIKTHLFFIAWKFDTWPPRQGIHVQDVHGCPRKHIFCTICLRKLIIKLAFCSHKVGEPPGHHDIVPSQGGLCRAARDAVSRVRKAGKKRHNNSNENYIFRCN